MGGVAATMEVHGHCSTEGSIEIAGGASLQVYKGVNATGARLIVDGSLTVGDHASSVEPTRRVVGSLVAGPNSTVAVGDLISISGALKLDSADLLATNGLAVAGAADVFYSTLKVHDGDVEVGGDLRIYHRFGQVRYWPYNDNSYSFGWPTEPYDVDVEGEVSVGGDLIVSGPIGSPSQQGRAYKEDEALHSWKDSVYRASPWGQASGPSADDIHNCTHYGQPCWFGCLLTGERVVVVGDAILTCDITTRSDLLVGGHAQLGANNDGYSDSGARKPYVRVHGDAVARTVTVDPSWHYTILVKGSLTVEQLTMLYAARVNTSALLADRLFLSIKS